MKSTSVMSSSSSKLGTSFAMVFVLLVAVFVDYADSINCYECFGHGCQAKQLAERQCPPNVDRCMTVYSNQKISPDKVLVKNCSQVWVNWRDECNMVVRVDQLLANVTGARIPQSFSTLQDPQFTNQDQQHSTASSSSSLNSNTNPTNRPSRDVTGYVCTCTGDLCNSGHSLAATWPSMAAALAVALVSIMKR